MIKRALTFIVPAFMLVYFTGCVGVTFSAISGETVLGSGQMTTVEYTVDPYTAVDIGGGHGDIGIELYYTAAQSDKVVIELQENLAEHLDVSVQDGVLLIKAEKQLKTDSGKTPKLYISAPTLKKMTISGAVAIKQADAIKAEKFVLDISGASSGELSIEAGGVDIDVSGACDLTFSGSADEAFFKVSGASNIDALELQTKQCGIDMSGVGSVSVNCTEVLEVDISGMGDISYKGNPQVSQNNNGLASIKKLD